MNCNQIIVLGMFYRGNVLALEQDRNNYSDDIAWLKRRGMLIEIHEEVKITETGRTFIDTCLSLQHVTTFRVPEAKS